MEQALATGEYTRRPSILAGVCAGALALITVIASTNDNTPGMHQQSECLLNEHVLPAIALAQPDP